MTFCDIKDIYRRHFFIRTTNIILVCLAWRSPKEAWLFGSVMLLRTSELLLPRTNSLTVPFARSLFCFLFSCFHRRLPCEQPPQPFHSCAKGYLPAVTRSKETAYK
ncbi:hypothetical protein ACN38_g5753 [Penicillium nordicum]|uniref:Uncharacterized protein n=1 Tax=Penicillium nordicum TaxID=229535 RepID=A0A0M8P8A4_9EURO|nr:hypothetical protein ACN38_g5753 [Penicillium nordicum]